jgi:hypothetical protein
MAGAGIKVFEAGQKLTANQVNSYLMDQAIAVFDDATARDNAFGGVGEPNLSQGRVCYLKSDDKVYVYTATGWTEIGAQIETDEITTSKIIDGAVTSAKIASATIVNANINASAAIALSKLATGTQGTVVIHNSSGVPTATALSGDVTVTNAGVTAIGSGRVTSDMIAAGAIVDSDINASASIALSKLATGALPTSITVASANIVDGTIVDGDISSSASIALSKLATGALPTAITVASANIVDGTIVNVDISSSASVAYSKLNLSGSIVNADVSTSAAIAHSKLANATSGQVLLGTTTSGVITATTLSGDVTVTGAGVTAIGSGKVTSDMIADGAIVNADINAAAAIAYTKLNLSTSIVNADISSSAAIAYSKLNLSTSIVNADISTTASIAYSKLNLSGSIVNADISSSAAIADSKLATISTAGKVSNSATTATDANTGSAIVSRDSSGNFSAGTISVSSASVSGRFDATTVREAVIDASVSASVVTADFSTGDIFYVGTAPTSNFTLNLTNAPTDNGKTVTVVIFVTQGATGYIPSAVQVAGVGQTIKWANGSAPTPTSSAGKIDIFSFIFVRRSSAWTVFGSSNLGY